MTEGLPRPGEAVLNVVMKLESSVWIDHVIAHLPMPAPHRETGCRYHVLRDLEGTCSIDRPVWVGIQRYCREKALGDVGEGEARLPRSGAGSSN
jgi:hypothetical protein